MTQLSAILLIGLIWLVYSQWARWPLDLVGLFCAGFLLFYGFRSLVVAFGLDQLYPEYLFGANGSILAGRTNLLLCLFLGGVIGGLTLSSRFGLHLPRPLFPEIVNHPRGSRYLAVVAALTGVSTAITLVLFARYGGFSGLLRAAKYDRDLTGLNVLRIVPSIGALVAVASAIDVVRLWGASRSVGRRDRLMLSVVCALLNGYYVFAWGQRSVLAMVVFSLIAGLVIFRPPRSGSRPSSLRIWGGITMAAIIGVVAVVGLRVARDTAATGDLSPNLKGQSVVRQLSVATNSTSYDALALVHRDWPAVFPYRGGQDFAAGLAAAVPRVLLPDKPTSISTGAWLRRIYEPDTLNGWPPGAVGEWYLNFGLPGVLFGGVVSGIALGMLQFALRSSRGHPLAFVASVVVAFQVILLGVSIETPFEWLRWCIPLVIVARVLGASSAAGGGHHDVQASVRADPSTASA